VQGFQRHFGAVLREAYLVEDDHGGELAEVFLLLILLALAEGTNDPLRGCQGRTLKADHVDLLEVVLEEVGVGVLALHDVSNNSFSQRFGAPGLAHQEKWDL